MSELSKMKPLWTVDVAIYSGKRSMRYYARGDDSQEAIQRAAEMVPTKFYPVIPDASKARPFEPEAFPVPYRVPMAQASRAPKSVEDSDLVPMIRRYDVRSDPIGYEDGCDRVIVDRLTGEEILRYDLGDPANYSPSHGGLSDKDCLETMNRDIHEEIEASKSVVKYPPSEPTLTRIIRKKRREREELLAEARDLMEFLGDDATKGFRFGEYFIGEDAILRPALEAKGFTSISFAMGEADSFGPLIRNVTAVDPTGKRVMFQYG